MNISFHKKVRNGFIKIAKRNKKRCKIIKAEGNINEINKKIIEIINKKFKTNFKHE